jgi:hypothetical protein
MPASVSENRDGHRHHAAWSANPCSSIRERTVAAVNRALLAEGDGDPAGG